MQEAYMGGFPLGLVVTPGVSVPFSGCLYCTVLTHHPVGPTDTAVPVRGVINI